MVSNIDSNFLVGVWYTKSGQKVKNRSGEIPEIKIVLWFIIDKCDLHHLLLDNLCISAVLW